jgi:predicted nuclease with TOPRIM domain
MAEPASHTLAYLRRLDEKLDRLDSDVGGLRAEVGELRAEVGERSDRVEGRLGRIEEELLVLNGIGLRLEGREVETTRLKAMLDRHERGLADLGRRLDELEDTRKG